MTFYVENETEETFAEGEVSFSVEDTVEKVANAVLEMEGFKSLFLHHMSGDHKIAAFIFPATIISESFLNYLKNSVDILKQIL